MLDLAPMDGNDPGTIRFPADAGAVATAVGMARRFCLAEQLCDDLCARLAIVVEELVTNLEEHGGAPGTPIGLRLSRRGTSVELVLTDHGARFDPRDAVASDVPPERGGGAGILLVLAWATIEGYTSDHGINRLTVILPPRTAGEAG